MSALARKVARRKGIRASALTLITEIKNYLSDVTENDKVKLMGLRNNLNDIVNNLKEIDEEISNALDVNEIENDVIESLNFMSPIHILLAEISDKVDNLKLLSSHASSVGSIERRCKLPKLELPTFSGNPLEWQEFWDRFQASIHNNDNISDIDRFSYLKKYLAGTAYSTISGLTLSNANYKEAIITLLEDRYGNPQVQITAHMESLLKIKRVRSTDSVTDLRRLYNDVENCVRNLKSLKVETSTYGCLLIPILNERIPDELRVIISRKFGSNVWTLDTMLAYLNEELQANERCVSLKRLRVSDDEEEGSKQYTASQLYAGTNNGKLRCVYCFQDHPASKCRTVTNVESMITILRKHPRCFICLQSGHISRNCQSSYLCKLCNLRHHISICKKQHEDAASEGSNVNHTGVNVSNILLQTAKAKVSDIKGCASSVTRLMFDSGSQRSYISQEIRLKLQLKTLRKEKIIIKTFGDNDSKLQELDVVQFSIKKPL